MGGARALGLEHCIGSLTPGKQADLLLLQTDRIGMLSGAAPERIAVLQANGSDVDSVFVAGRPLKRDGRLVNVDAAAIAEQLAASRAHVEAATAQTDITPLRTAYSALTASP